jgi:hypothetical protein
VEWVLDRMGKLLEKAGELNLILEFHPPLLKGSDVDPCRFLGRLASVGLEVCSIKGGVHPLPNTETGAPGGEPTDMRAECLIRDS